MNRIVALFIFSFLPGGFAILAVLILFTGCASVYGGYTGYTYSVPAVTYVVKGKVMTSKKEVEMRGNFYGDPGEVAMKLARAAACRKAPQTCLLAEQGYGGYAGIYPMPAMTPEGDVYSPILPAHQRVGYGLRAGGARIERLKKVLRKVVVLLKSKVKKTKKNSVSKRRGR